MKFKPGDPVWAKSQGKHRVPAGEYAGVVLDYGDASGYYNVELFAVPVQMYFPSLPYKYWPIPHYHLRPRRDDYQQHEGLGSMDKINRPPDLNEAAIEEMCDFISSARKAHERS